MYSFESEGSKNNGTPKKVMDQVAAVSMGEGTYECAVLKKDGSLWIYNYGKSQKVMDDVTAVSTCGGTIAAVKTDASLWMWGYNYYGQLGNGNTEAQEQPVKILDNVASVSVCHSYTAAIKTDGSLWMWGDNRFGQLGNGMAHNASVPITGYSDDYNSIPTTVQHPCQTIPVKVMDQVASVSVNGGDGHSTHAIKTDGSLWCWGDNSIGQLGNAGASTQTISVAIKHADGSLMYDSYPIQDVPVKVMDGVAAVSSNCGTTAIVKRDGTLWVTGLSVNEGHGRYGSYSKSFEKVLDGVAVPQVAVEFTDVKPESYYHDAVQWAVGQGITNGTGDNAFSPDNTCTKAQILTFIWRAAGSPEPGITNPFTDVQSSDYYYKAALWAYKWGIADDTSFAGNTPCTRSMAVTYLWRAAGSPATAVSSTFDDVDAEAYYAQAVAWAVNNGVTNGTGDNQFSPNTTCTRGQIVTFLYRCGSSISPN